MSYQVVDAETAQEAILKSGFEPGQPAIVTEVVASMATGNNRYSVIPSVRPMTEAEKTRWESYCKQLQADPQISG